MFHLFEFLTIDPDGFIEHMPDLTAFGSGSQYDVFCMEMEMDMEDDFMYHWVQKMARICYLRTSDSAYHSENPLPQVLRMP